MYCKKFRFKLLECQPEPVEGGFEEAHRLRQAQPDTTTVTNFCHLQPVPILVGKSLKFILSTGCYA